MLIGGRTVQGLGSGAIQMMIDLIVADLVPLRERGNYMAMIQGTFALGSMVAPLIGGAIIEHTSWRVCISEKCIRCKRLLTCCSVCTVDVLSQSTSQWHSFRNDYFFPQSST
jgi:MFS family permease